MIRTTKNWTVVQNIVTQLWVLILYLTNTYAVSSDIPLVTINSGIISGSTGTTSNGRQFFSFEGIPYAEPPVGELRFAEPVQVEPWDGIKNTSEPGNTCLQLAHEPLPEGKRLEGEEDCLFINAYTPSLPDENDQQNMDVVVFIHGGGYTFGSSDGYGPEYLLDEDLVFVTFNYRVGILGFCSTGDSVVPGNNGLKDQVLALRWIQKNIKQFGGNPDSVTITGHSAGAGSVHYHYLSPLSKGLFHKGVSFSSTAIDPRHVTEAMPSKTARIAAAMNCPTETSKEMIQCLRQQDGIQLVNLTNLFQVWLYNSVTPFGPVIEVSSPTAFISKEPVQVIIDGEAAPLPWLSSLVTQEALYPVSQFAACDECLAELNADYRRIFPALLEYEYTVEDSLKDYVSDRIRKEYFGKKDISSDTVQNLIQMMNHRINYLTSQLSIQLQAKHTSADIYSYIFGYRGKHSFSEFFSGTDINWGVSHGDDVAYLIKVFYLDTNTTDEDRNMRKLFLKLLTSYFRTGVPAVPHELNVTWTPEEKDGKKLSFLYIDSPEKVVMMSVNDIGNNRFWRSLPIHENDGVTARN